jgi:DNA-binding SARP family transcriptional activator/tetratricopeptide (TPR) repeat protein
VNTPPSRLEVRVLGPPVVRIDGQPLHTDTRKAVALLAYLTQRETSPTRDFLVELLWPDSTAERGRGALRRTVSTLRTALGGRWVEADRERVHLDRTDLSLDTDALAGDPEQAVKLVRGRFLDGFILRDAPEFDDWAFSTAEHYERVIRTALNESVNRAMTRGDTAAARTHAERLVALDPLDESAHRAVMRVHASAGDRSAATRQFRRCVAVLEAELAVAPLPETVELHEAIMAGRGVDTPSGQSVEQRPQVPAPRLIGRDEELAALRLASSTPGVTWLTGLSGSGRTFFVAEALPHAISVTAHPGDAALPHAVTRSLLEEALSKSSAMVLDEAAAAAGHLHRGVAALAGDAPPLDDALGPVRLLAGVAAAVSQMAGTIPVVVDDFDEADPASKEVFLFMAGRAADLGLRLVFVAREPAGSGHVVHLGPLSAESVGELIGQTVVDPNDLVEVTGGLPGPIIEVLAGPEPELALVRARAQRVAALDPEARQVLEGLVALGSGAPSTIAAVTGRGMEETSAAVDRLIGAGLVSGEGTIEAVSWVIEPVLGSLGPARLALLHSRAADSMGRITDPKSAAVRAHHLQAAGRRDEAVMAHAEAGQLAASIHAHDTARTHFHQALAGGHPEPGVLHRRLGDVERAAGRYGEAVAAYHAAASYGTDVELERSIGDVYRRWGRWELADAGFAAAEAIAGAADLPRVLADRAEVALRAGDPSKAENLVLAAMEAGGEQEARVRNVAGLVLDDVGHLEAAVALARRASEREAEAAALNNLALAWLRRGQSDLAAEAGSRALALLDRIGDRHRRAAVHGNLADICHALGDEDASRTHLRQAVELFAEIGIEPGQWEPAVWSLTSW